MARKKNATFAGASLRDLNIGSATFKRVIENAIGDLALIFDKATGSNGEAGRIFHDGSDGGGALLGLPVINQWVGRTLTLTSPTAKGSSGGLGVTEIFPCPFYLSAGESELIVEVGMVLSTELGRHFPGVKVFDVATGTVADHQVLVQVLDDPREEDFYVAKLTGLTPGWNVLSIGIDTSDIDGHNDIGTLNYVRARPRLRRGSPGRESLSGMLGAPTWDDVGPGNLFGVSTPAATEGTVFQDMHAAMFANLESICDWILSRGNRSISGLAEFISSFTAGGNHEYTHVDHDGAGADDAKNQVSNPARSRFEAHTRSLYGGAEPAGEGQIDFPLWAESYGAFLDAGLFAVELVEPPAKGMLNWFARWPKATTSQTIGEIFVPVPDFQSAASRLQMLVLCGSEHNGTADPTQWTFTTSGAAAASPVVIPGTSNHLWAATITGVAFTGDNDETIPIVSSRAGAKPAGTNGIGEICVLGAALAFVKP